MSSASLSAHSVSRADGIIVMSSQGFLIHGLKQLGERNGCIAHAGGETPLIIVPGQSAHNAIVHDLGLRRVVVRRVRIVIADTAKAVDCYPDNHAVSSAGNEVLTLLHFCAATLTAYAAKRKSQAFC